MAVFRNINKYLKIFKDYVEKNTKIIIRNVVLIFFLAVSTLVIVGFGVFWITRKGPPEVVVPNISGKNLMEALLVLQKKGLGVTIDPRYFTDFPEYTIVDQEPKPGSIVRQGRKVKLIVSKGPIISIVEDYTGKTVNYVRSRLQEIFSFQGKSIQIGKITYVTSDLPEGTIVAQYPPPNTPIGSVDKIDLVVSKGKELQAFYLENYTGRFVDEVMEILALRGVIVNVITEEVMNPDMNGRILSQEPEPGTVVKRNDTVTFHVGYLPSEKEKEKLYARVLNFDIPADREKVNVKIAVKDRIGEREIYNAENKGGESISVPFKSYTNTRVFIYLDDELYEIRDIK